MKSGTFPDFEKKNDKKIKNKKMTSRREVCFHIHLSPHPPFNLDWIFVTYFEQENPAEVTLYLYTAAFSQNPAWPPLEQA